VRLALESKQLPVEAWELVLPDALHSIRSLLCTSTNETPHERFFSFTRKSSSGNSIPSWMTSSEKALLRKHARNSKHDPLVELVELVNVNPTMLTFDFLTGERIQLLFEILDHRLEKILQEQTMMLIQMLESIET
jgi:hypothetical protein